MDLPQRRLPPRAQTRSGVEAIARMDALIVAYLKAPGITGDVLEASPRQAAAGLIADVLLWAEVNNVRAEDVLAYARVIGASYTQM